MTRARVQPMDGQGPTKGRAYRRPCNSLRCQLLSIGTISRWVETFYLPLGRPVKSYGSQLYRPKNMEEFGSSCSYPVNTSAIPHKETCLRNNGRGKKIKSQHLFHKLPKLAPSFARQTSRHVKNKKNKSNHYNTLDSKRYQKVQSKMTLP